MSTHTTAEQKKCNWRHRASMTLLNALLAFLRTKPRGYRRKLVKTLGRCTLFCSSTTRLRAIRNIANALPDLPVDEIKTLASEAYANCAFGVAESFWLEQLEPEIFCDESTLRILQSGSGACIATMHLGCYEAVPLAVQRFTEQSVTLTNIPTFINDGIAFYTKANIIAIDKNSPSAFAELIKHSSNNAYISLHCDLWANEFCVNFFQQQTKAPAGVALLAKLSKKPLLLGYAVYQKNYQIQVFFETIDQNTPHQSQVTVEQLMQKIYHRFEQIIRKHPEQWYWSYKRWRKLSC